MRIFVGIVVSAYISFNVLLGIPSVQHFFGRLAQSALSIFFGTEVRVGRIYIAFNARVIIDDILIKDQNNKVLLEITRLAVKPNFVELIGGKVAIDNGSVFGMTANLYQNSPQEKKNFDFILEKLKGDKSKSSPSISIGQILVRRGNISWNQNWEPRKNNVFSPSHINIRNISLTACLKELNVSDSLNLDIKRFSFEEESGFKLKNMRVCVQAGRSGCNVKELSISLPESEITTDYLSILWKDLPHGELKSWIQTTNGRGALNLDLSTNDFSAFVPALNGVDNRLQLHLKATSQGDAINLSQIELNDDRGLLELKANANVANITEWREQLSAKSDIQKIHVSTLVLDDISKIIGKDLPHNDFIDKLAFIDLNGDVNYNNQTLRGDIDIISNTGGLSINGWHSINGDMEVHAKSDGLDLTHLPIKKEGLIGHTAFEVNAKGCIKNFREIPQLDINGIIQSIELKGYEYHDIQFNAQHNNKHYLGQVTIDDPYAKCSVSADLDLAKSHLNLDALVEKIVPYELNLSKKYQDTEFGGRIKVNLDNTTLEQLEGNIHINDLYMTDADGEYRPGDIHINSAIAEDGKHIYLISPFMEAQIDGVFNPRQLMSAARQIVNRYMPNLVTYDTQDGILKDNIKLRAKVFDPTPLNRLLGTEINILPPISVSSSFDAATNDIKLDLTAPYIKYNKEELHDILFHLANAGETISTDLSLQRIMKGKPVYFNFDAEGSGEALTANLSWENGFEKRRHSGLVKVDAQISKADDGKQRIEASILPSEIMINDTVWRIHPANLLYHNKRLEVENMRVSSGEHYLNVKGTASKNEEDTMRVDLNKIELAYVFDIVNFHAVDFDGIASGHAYAHSLFSKPNVDAHLNVGGLALNKGLLGDAILYGNWGKNDKSIYLEADIRDPKENSYTYVDGTITPAKGEKNGLDLNIKADRTNIYFLNKFTAGIFDNMQGRVSGWAHLYGPFRKLNIEGDALVNEGSLGIPLTGVRYHMMGDSVILRPDNIYFSRARIYDEQGRPDKKGHSAYVDGHLSHTCFSNMHYNVKVEADNILSYDFKELDELPFCGTVWASGNVTIDGEPGRLDINLKGTPQPGTRLLYDATTPDAITDTKFMTFVDRSVVINENTEVEHKTPQVPETEMDVRLNFDLDVTNRSTMQILMDAKAGDNIMVNGNGRIFASWYNKGDFLMYGTYHVQHGLYKLSLQDIVRKDFTIQDGGTVVFSGNPMNADINLQAIYTVPSVSLNDLSGRSTFSNTNVRVNCLMNIDGKPSAPRITFDFDIPNVNEDEKQMVKSLISTEEERNMQVIYLLGIGRFYTYDYTGQNQSYTAMNSLLSSTLSGQLNQMLSNMIGNNNWNVGANLSTNETGWSSVDVEGMLSGRLLNNRLLFNGNFGYRDTPMANTNFVGDFDLQYLLTPRGNIRFKAYSETNDKYFTKSALTTQGVGILFKKDFSKLKELFKSK